MLLLPYKSMLAIGAVVDVALHSREGLVSARDLAERLHLPRRRYLEHVLQALVREGILLGARGPNGGYKLAQARHAITAYDVFQAVKTVEPEKRSEEFPGLLGAVIVPALAQAEQCFASALKRLSVEDLVRSATLQILAGYTPNAEAG
jgi:Rrf2 family protein